MSTSSRSIFFAALRAPILGCPGNHDAPVFDPIARIWTPFQRFRKLGLASAWDSSCGTVSIRALNSACAIQGRPDWSQGIYRPEDFAALAVSFAPLAQHRIIACHHPPHAPSPARMPIATRGLSAALPLLKGEHVFLCGHLHHSADYPVTGFAHLRVMTTPTLTSTRERGEPPGFRLITISSSMTATIWSGDEYAAGFPLKWWCTSATLKDHAFLARSEAWRRASVSFRAPQHRSRRRRQRFRNRCR